MGAVLGTEEASRRLADPASVESLGEAGPFVVDLADGPPIGRAELDVLSRAPAVTVALSDAGEPAASAFDVALGRPGTGAGVVEVHDVAHALADLEQSVAAHPRGRW